MGKRFERAPKFGSSNEPKEKVKKPESTTEIETDVIEGINKLKQDVEANPPTEAEVAKEERRTIIGNIREKHSILFISPQNKEVYEKLGLKTTDDQWFKEALGLQIDSDRIKTVHAIDESLPDTIEEDAIIIAGSAHSTYEDKPWIHRLEAFTKAAVEKGKPVLGVCFGHQLIIQSLGGKVEKGKQGKELGVRTIDLDTEEGVNDPLFEGLPQSFKTAFSHGDVVTELPPSEKIAVLARNDLYDYQALAIGDRVRSVQFHPEIDTETISQVVRARANLLIEEGIIKDAKELANYLKEIEEAKVEETGRKILQNFDRNFIIRYGKKP